MRKFLFMAAMLLSTCVHAQVSLMGIVKGTHHDKLSGATVQLSPLNRVAVTDEFGKFGFDRLQQGDYKIIVRFLGYADTTLQVKLVESAVLEIQMRESPFITDQVIVEATRAGSNTPATFTNVDKQDIQKQNFGQDLPYLLNWTPSLVTTSDAGAGIGYTGVRIRGNDATRINVTINGIPYNDSESLGTFWVDIPDIASSAQSIQIQRGAGTSTNGAGAFGGSVNVQTNSLNSEPYAQLTTSYGSFNTRRFTMNAGTGLINDHWAFDGRFSRINSDGYVDRATSDLSSYYLSGGYYGKNTILKGIVFGGHEKTYQSWYGIDPDMVKVNRTFNYAGAIYDDNWNVIRYYDNQVDDYRQDHAQLHFSHAFNPLFNVNISLHYTHGSGFYEEYAQAVPFESMGLPDITIGDSTLTGSDFVTRKWLDNHFYGSTFSLNRSTDKIDLIIGGGYHRYSPAKHYGEIIWAEHASNSQPGQKYYEGESDKSDFNIYGKLNYMFTVNLSGYVDLQYRNVNYKTSGIDDGQVPYSIDNNFNFFNPKAGLMYSMTKQDQLYLSYAVAHREPTRSDYLAGDIEPIAEKLNNLEAGWKRKTANYQLELNYYLMSYKDQLVLTGSLDNVGNPIRRNIGKSYRTGIELNSTIRIYDNLSWSANVTWSQNKNIDYVWFDINDQPVIRNTTTILSPEWIAGSRLTWKPIRAFNISYLAKYVGSQYLDNTEDESLKLDGYFINDLRFSYEIFPGGIKGMELGLLVNNVFDVEYASNGYVYDGTPYIYPQAGRNFLAMLNIKF